MGDQSPLEDDEIDNEEEFDVECVLAERLGDDGQPRYLIKWMGYDEPEDNTWEPEDNIFGDSILSQWSDVKLRQLRGLEVPFDVQRWRRLVDTAQEEKERQSRAQKHHHSDRRRSSQQPVSSDSESDEAQEVQEPLDNGRSIGLSASSAQAPGFRRAATIFRAGVTAQASPSSEANRIAALPSSSSYAGTARPELARSAVSLKAYHI